MSLSVTTISDKRVSTDGRLPKLLLYYHLILSYLSYDSGWLMNIDVVQLLSTLNCRTCPTPCHVMSSTDSRCLKFHIFMRSRLSRFGSNLHPVIYIRFHIFVVVFSLRRHLNLNPEPTIITPHILRTKVGVTMAILLAVMEAATGVRAVEVVATVMLVAEELLPVAVVVAAVVVAAVEAEPAPATPVEIHQTTPLPRIPPRESVGLFMDLNKRTNGASHVVTRSDAYILYELKKIPGLECLVTLLSRS